jgi:serine phosphatase RsbU (regulator of sigma subunit)
MIQILIRRLWFKLSNLGINPMLPFEKRKNISLTNQFSIAWLLIILIFSFVFAIIAPKGLLFSLGSVCVMILVLVSNFVGLYTFSRLLFYLGLNSLLCIFVAYVTPNEVTFRPAGYYMLLISLMTIPFIIFSNREYIYLIICILYSILCYIAYDFINILFNYNAENQTLTTKNFEFVLFITSGILLSISMIFLRRTNVNYQHQIICLLDEAHAKTKELEKQKKSLEQHQESLETKHQQVTESRDLIYEQNKALTDSIYYALRIQKAVLPPLSSFDEFFEDNFILYKPCNIVSGDYYFYLSRGSNHVIAVGDCTGHGVPAGFLSMLGIAFLGEIIGRHNTLQPNILLEEMRQKFISSLRQTGKLSDSADGMDMAICVINTDEKAIHFSGAYSQMLILRDGEMMEINGDKSPVGFHMEYLPFTKHTYNYKKGDKFYLFTDGYQDQFGGIERKKFGKRRFKELIREIHSHPLNKQKAILERKFNNWRNDFDQIDDILIIGFSIKE